MRGEERSEGRRGQNEKMTASLEAAIRRIEALSPEEQDAIAADIMESLDDEDAWERRFVSNPELLQRMGAEALEAHRRLETRPLDELLD